MRRRLNFLLFPFFLWLRSNTPRVIINTRFAHSLTGRSASIRYSYYTAKIEGKGWTSASQLTQDRLEEQRSGLGLAVDISRLMMMMMMMMMTPAMKPYQPQLVQWVRPSPRSARGYAVRQPHPSPTRGWRDGLIKASRMKRKENSKKGGAALSSGRGASPGVTRSFPPRWHSVAGSTSRPRHVRPTAPVTAGKRNLTPGRQRVTASCSNSG